MNVDQVIDSLCKGDDDVSTFMGIEVDPGESQSESSTFAHFERPKRLSSSSSASNRASFLAKGGDAFQHGRRQRHSEVYRG